MSNFEKWPPRVEKVIHHRFHTILFHFTEIIENIENIKNIKNTNKILELCIYYGKT
jgi:hypothetical protein